MNKQANQSSQVVVGKPEGIMLESLDTTIPHFFFQEKTEPLDKESWGRNHSRNCIFSPVC